MVKEKIISIVLVTVFGVALCVIAAKKILPRVSRNTESTAPADSQARELMKQMGIRGTISDPFRYLNRYYSRGDLKKLFPEGGVATADELVKKLGPPSMRGAMAQVPGEMWFYVYDEKTANGNPYKSAFIGFMIDDGKVSSWVIDNRNMYSKPRTKKELDSLLKVGMTREQVCGILGEPCNAESFSSAETYRYRKEDCFIENGLMYDGFRLFYRDGKLEGWLTGHVYPQGNAQPLRPGHEDAVSRYRKLAAQGNAQAQYDLAVCYYQGRGVSPDYAEGLKWFRKAADQGNALAQYNLGVCYINGIGVNKDPAEAVKWFRKAAEKGEDMAQYGLGTCFEEGRGVPQDPAEAVKWYRKAADQGNVFAQYSLGVCCYKGLGVRQNYAEAVKWLRKAAEQGDAANQYSFGLNMGLFLRLNFTSEKSWNEDVKQKIAAAQALLGFFYANGWSVNKDPAEAVKWWRKAAEQGDAMAQYNLAVCYLNGLGVSRDPAEAVKWYRKAADQGYTLAQYTLGMCYYKGLGVKPDHVETVKWFRKAADQGYALAQFNLGACYYNGLGVSRDKAEAEKWWRKAADQGYESAKKALVKMNK